MTNQAPSTTADAKSKFSWLTGNPYTIPAIIAAIVFICFHYTIGNQFTNWDDDYYVTNDKYIKALTLENLKVIFTQDITQNNYHPFCMLSLAINYLFAGLNPASYYLTNILIHIANSLLVFAFVKQLSSAIRLGKDSAIFMASIAGLWFGIHPMHVESVAWIAERKDVLYTLFYIWGMITYLKSKTADNPSVKTKQYWITYILFVSSVLSKPMSVTFPVALMCIDYLIDEKITIQQIIHKSIFWLTSLAFGAAAYYTQHRTGAIADFTVLTIQERIMYASYGFTMYISKFFNPTGLSTFYPYPYRYTTGFLPAIYYIAPFIATLLPLSLLFITYKLNKKIFWVVAFGFGFFLSNLIFVLQFISCGAAIMADRYSYCAYIGWLFMIAYLLNLVRLHFPQFRSSLVIVLTLFSISLGVLCYGRTLAWHDAESLLTDAIERYPKQALLSYKWRGNFYLDKAYKTNDPSFASKALDDYHILTLLRSADRYVWRNIGKAYSLLGDYNKADEAFNMSTQLEAMGKGALAGDPANQATVIPADNAPVNPNQQPNNNPQDTTLTNQLSAANGKQKADPATEKKINEMAFSHVQAGKFEAALAEYNILLKMNNRNPYYYFYRGVAKYSTGKIQDAITDWEVSMVFNNTEVQKSAAFNLAIAYDTIGNDTMAVRYAKDAQKFGWDVKPEYMAKWQKRADAQKRKK